MASEPRLSSWQSYPQNRAHPRSSPCKATNFARQPLLPKKLSQLGPGITWFDFDRDGHEDLIIGSGKAGRMAVFRSDGKGGFVLVDNPALSAAVVRDQTCAVGTAAAQETPAVLVGSSNYDD